MQLAATIAPSKPHRAIGLAPASFTATDTSTEMVSADTDRVGIVFTNLSNQPVFIAFGPHDAVVGAGIMIAGMGGRLSLDSSICIVGSIQVIAGMGMNVDIAIQEFE